MVNHAVIWAVVFLLSCRGELFAQGGDHRLSWTNKVGARKTPSSRKVYWVNDFGAVNDGTTLSTAAIQKAVGTRTMKMFIPSLTNIYLEKV